MLKSTLIIISLLLLSACGDAENQSSAEQKEQTSPIRKMDFSQISRGGKLFQQNCASCHGDQAQGLVTDWRKTDVNGKLPAPPLNGSAHAWHHPKKVLVRTIKNGTAQLGGNMPAWKDKLSDDEINDIIAWFQSKWPDEIYAAWYERDLEAGK